MMLILNYSPSTAVNPMSFTETHQNPRKVNFVTKRIKTEPELF